MILLFIIKNSRNCMNIKYDYQKEKSEMEKKECTWNITLNCTSFFNNFLQVFFLANKNLYDESGSFAESETFFCE